MSSAHVIAVGFFDGVHRGHQKILVGADAVLTFINHPLSMLAPKQCPKLLMSTSERRQMLSQFVGEVRMIRFTQALAAETPAKFIARLRRMFPQVRELRFGPNWRFGAGGVGSSVDVRKAGLVAKRVGFSRYKGETISSTRVREILTSGDVASVANMTGRLWIISGKIFVGKGEGLKFGFPTVNVKPNFISPLRFGVYAVKTAFGFGVANYGFAPTFGKRAWKEPVLEVHLLGKLKHIPKGKITVEFIGFIRSERKFVSAVALQRQISKDISKAEDIFRKA